MLCKESNHTYKYILRTVNQLGHYKQVYIRIYQLKDAWYWAIIVEVNGIEKVSNHYPVAYNTSWEAIYKALRIYNNGANRKSKDNSIY